MRIYYRLLSLCFLTFGLGWLFNTLFFDHVKGFNDTLSFDNNVWFSIGDVLLILSVFFMMFTAGYILVTLSRKLERKLKS